MPWPSPNGRGQGYKGGPWKINKKRLKQVLVATIPIPSKKIFFLGVRGRGRLNSTTPVLEGRGAEPRLKLSTIDNTVDRPIESADLNLN